MLDKMITYAKNHEGIRAVLLNGSRVNDKVKPDDYQDYDVVYMVDDISQWITLDAWLDFLGPRLMMQKPDQNDLDRKIIHEVKDRFAYLILLKTGIRIDLTLATPPKVKTIIKEDSLTKVLLDKDSLLTDIDPPSEKSYYLKKPDNEATFQAIYNDFYWCSQNVLKGIKRQEWPYANTMFHHILMKHLNTMIQYAITVKYAPKCVNVGAFNKWLGKFLTKAHYQAYLNLVFKPEEESAIKTLLESLDLFYYYAETVALQCGFQLDDLSYQNMKDYILRFQS